MRNENVKIAEIAIRSGVSSATVSRVLNGRYGHRPETVALVKNAVSRIRQEHLARERGSECLCVGILMGTYPNFLGNAYTAPLVSSMIEELTRRNFAAQFVTMSEMNINLEIIEQHVRQFQLRGLLVPMFWNMNKVFPRLKSLNIPLVFVASPDGEVEYSVSNDDDSAGRRAAGVFVSRGHRQLGILTMSTADRTQAIRCESFIDEACKLGANPHVWVWECDWYDGSLENAVTEILNSANPPTALFCTCSTLALNLYLALSHSRLRIPEDISLLSIEENGELSPLDVSAMCQPVREMGGAAAKMLVKLIRHEEVAIPHQVYNCFLKSRKTIADVTNVFPKTKEVLK